MVVCAHLLPVPTSPPRIAAPRDRATLLASLFIVIVLPFITGDPALFAPARSPRIHRRGHNEVDYDGVGVKYSSGGVSRRTSAEGGGYILLAVARHKVVAWMARARAQREGVVKRQVFALVPHPHPYPLANTLQRAFNRNLASIKY